MQDIDGPAHIERLPEPAGECRARVEAQAHLVVTRAQHRDGILAHGRRRRYLGKRPAIRSPEPEDPVGPARDLIALLVNGAMMPTAQKGEVRQRGGPALGPVLEMMPLAEADTTAREAAALIPVLQHPS
jgi:hypothetical protein